MPVNALENRFIWILVEYCFKHQHDLCLIFQYNDQLEENERLRKVIDDLKEGSDHCDKSNHQGSLPDKDE